MACFAAAVAAGEELLLDRSGDAVDASPSLLPGKRPKRTVLLTHQPRPLFVAEAEFRAFPKLFPSKHKKALLVLYGWHATVCDIAALEGAEHGSGGSSSWADESVGVLRLINYHDLLEVCLCGSTSLRVEYADSRPGEKPKTSGMGAAAAVAAATHSGSGADSGSVVLSSRSAPGRNTTSSSGSSASSSATAPAGAPGAVQQQQQPQQQSMRVAYESFTLNFRDAATAQAAAAALLYQRAQHEGALAWLQQGLPMGLACDLVSVAALPLAGGRHGQQQQQQQQQQRRASAAAGRGESDAAAAAGAASYPWAAPQGAAGWGGCVPLPRSWEAVIEAAAADAAAAPPGAVLQDVTLDDLSCPRDVPAGPAALLVTLSTPLGAAVATVTPQHVRAALLNSSCRQVLAVPLRHNGGGGGGGGNASALQQGSGASAAAVVSPAFSWRVSSRVPRAADGTAGGVSDAAAAAAGSARSLDWQPGGGLAGSAGSSSSSMLLATQHNAEVFAAVTLEVVRTPHTAGTRAAGRVFCPDAAAAFADRRKQQASEQQLAAGGPPAAAGSNKVGAAQALWQLLQLGAMALLACLLLPAQPQLAALQLTALALLAGAAWWAPSSNSGSSSSSKRSPLKGHAAASSRSAAAAAAASWALDGELLSSRSSFCGIPGPPAEAAAAAGECVDAAGWSLRLVGGDVVPVPGRYLQLQVSMARAELRLARLRQRVASMSSGGAAGAPGGLLPLAAASDVPVLVSQPEPSWLDADTKQRFLNAKPTLEASQEQARRTHKWRVAMEVDSVLTRPCPSFEAISAALPTYILSEDSPDGHAIVLMKVGGIKDLCDAVFNPPPGTAAVSLQDVEHTLALLNEYLVKVAAPKPLPAGFQVQIYDLDGFKLGYALGDVMTLFKILVRFGHYYPERLHQALVINAPAWFAYPWKIMNAFLDANTSAKVVVVGSPKGALATLSHHLGGTANVPAAWGGSNKTPYDRYPGHQRMMDFARRLNAGEQPFAELQQQQQEGGSA